MKLCFSLGWSDKQHCQKAFKSIAASELFQDYLNRLAPAFKIEIAGTVTSADIASGDLLWVCHTSKSSKLLSSEALGSQLQKTMDRGIKRLIIAIGGADGFMEEQLQGLKPDLLWNFGPLTFPHELAAVIASEQIYRAWSILNHLPYHCEHNQKTKK